MIDNGRAIYVDWKIGWYVVWKIAWIVVIGLSYKISLFWSVVSATKFSYL